MQVKSKHNEREVVPTFTPFLARNVLLKSGACSFKHEYSSHFCKTFGEVIFPSLKVTGLDENENIIGEIIVCEKCGSIDSDKIIW